MHTRHRRENKCERLKALTQNYKTNKVINYDVIKAMIAAKDEKQPVVLHDTAIVRNKYNMELQTVNTTKMYSYMYNKGHVGAYLKAWPYGY